MGNKQTEDSDIDRTPEYINFIRTLEQYHARRGTHLAKEPALGPRRVSLLKLYQRILALGGYDKVSDTPMLWKQIAAEYKVPPMSNAGMPGYLLKTMYYKNLAAFEIETHWKLKAPPPELLESLTARGGAIMRRPNVVNPPSPKSPTSTSRLPAHHAQRPRPTPASRNSTQSLLAQQHQQQQQMQMLQQQNYSPRPRAPIAAAAASPAVQTPVSQAEATWFERDGPFMKPIMPLTAGQFGSQTLVPDPNAIPQPYISPDITLRPPVERVLGRLTAQQLGRVALALKSQLPSEMQWAMKQLVKATYEQGDDLLLERTSGLAEALMDTLARGLDDLIGTQSGQSLHDEPTAKRVKRSEYFAQRAQEKAPYFLEAALILSNASLQADNAKYISRLSQAPDIFLRALSLPVSSATIEVRHYCMSMLEAGVGVLGISTEDHPLYRLVAGMLISADRHDLLFALRTLVRLSAGDEQNRLLQDIKQETIHGLVQHLLSTDDELIVAIVEFLFQYTSYKANTKALASNAVSATLLRQLLALTTHGGQIKVDAPVQVRPVKKAPAPAGPPMLPEELVQELTRFAEPERAIHWMQACFEAGAPSDDVTQISLWQSYRSRFQSYVTPQQALLQAADLIKMVNTAFPNATAMVMQAPDGQRFIIRGIRPRETPVAPSGQTFMCCKWLVDATPPAQETNGQLEHATNGTSPEEVLSIYSKANPPVPCGLQFATTRALHAHILQEHLPKDGSALTRCWQGCQKHARQPETDMRKAGFHVRTHLPTPAATTTAAVQPRTTPSGLRLESRITARDEKGEARGVAMLSTAILKNLARAEPSLFERDVLQPQQFEKGLLMNLALNPVLAAQSAQALCQLSRA